MTSHVCLFRLISVISLLKLIKYIRTRPGAPFSGNFYIKSSSLSLNRRSFVRFGAKLWNSYPDKFRQLPKSAFKKHVHDSLLLIMGLRIIMLKRLFFCTKLLILHNLCIKCIVLLDFLKLLILRFSFYGSSCFHSFNLILLYLI